MNDELRKKISAIAEEHGLDPDMLEAAFTSGEVPEALEKGMEAVMGDVELYTQALKKLDS